MPWFYYSGKIPKPIPVKRGLTVSAIPHSRIEIFDTNLKEIQVLRRKGELRPTGKPAGAPSIKSVPITTSNDIKAVTPRSNMARSTAEKGSTKNPGMTPRMPNGHSPEMTDGELEIIQNKSVEASKQESDTENDFTLVNNKESDIIDTVVNSESKLDEQSDTKDAEVVEVLSNVDSSPEENKGDGGKTRKKRRRKK